MTPAQEKLIRMAIEHAKDACDRALKHQNFDGETDDQFRSGWEAAIAVCKTAIERNVMEYVERDLLHKCGQCGQSLTEHDVVQEQVCPHWPCELERKFRGENGPAQT